MRIGSSTKAKQFDTISMETEVIVSALLEWNIPYIQKLQ
jgi:hypothetical protein